MVTKLAGQKDYWDHRASEWDELDIPLIPDRGDVVFQKSFLKKGGNVLVLGATRELCMMAREVSNRVLAVDYSSMVISAIRCDGVEYKESEWLDYLANTQELFDSIITDGGLLCLEFPENWTEIAKQIFDHLKPGGFFVARVYRTTDKPPKGSYENPNLNRFISGLADINRSNWMLKPKHEAYAKYEMRYSLPPDKVIKDVFNNFKLIKVRVPDYEAGEYFPTYAWMKP